MPAGTIEAVWMDEQFAIDLAGLAERSGLSTAELVELVECGVLLPRTATAAAAAEWTFSAQCLVSVRAASRLREDFELDTNGMALAITLLERIRALEQALDAVRAEYGRG